MGFTMAALSTNWLAELIPLPQWSGELAKNLLNPEGVAYQCVHIGLPLVLLGLLLVLSYYAPTLAAVFQGVRSLEQREVRGHQVAIFAVSDHTGDKETKLKAIVGREPIPTPKTGEAPVLTFSLEQDWAILVENKGFWLPSLMIVRGAAPHYRARTLKRIHLVVSEASNRNLDLVCCVLKRYFPGLEIAESPVVDFDNIDDLAQTFERIIDRETQRGTPVQEIIIDITGGNKPVSIAGAMATVSNRVKFQYVPNDWQDASPIRQFDLVNLGSQ